MLCVDNQRLTIMSGHDGLLTSGQNPKIKMLLELQEKSTGVKMKS